jgi:hypothetical protein
LLLLILFFLRFYFIILNIEAHLIEHVISADHFVQQLDQTEVVKREGSEYDRCLIEHISSHLAQIAITDVKLFKHSWQWMSTAHGREFLKNKLDD